MKVMKSTLLVLITTLSMQVWGLDCSTSTITLTTQEEVDNFQATYGGGGLCDRVSFRLTVSGSDITDIDGLSNLASVGSYLEIENNVNLTNIDGLANLVSVGFLLSINNNSALTDIDSLVNLTNVGSGLRIIGNDALTNINGLISLTTMGTNGLLIWDNMALTNIDGLASLNSVGWKLDIRRNDSLTNIDGLVSLTSVYGREDGGVTISENNALTNIDGLANLTSVDAGVGISLNPALTNINGLANLTSVGGGLGIANCDALTNIDGLANITSLGGNLVFSYNTALTNLDSLANLTSVGGYLQILGNSALGNCSALAPLLGWPDGPPNDNIEGVIAVQSNNSPGCNSVQEILDSASGPTAPSITSSDAFNGQATLTFLPSTTTDALWTITAYYAQCLADEQSVFENSMLVNIPDEGSVTSNLTVSGVPSKNAAGLSIPINITHPRTRHLTLILTSPGGSTVTLWDKDVGDGENLIGTFPTTLETAESLEAFDGEDFNGEWQLTVADGIASQTGTLNSWGITVQDKVTATSVTSPIMLTGLADSRSYTCTVAAMTGLGIGPESNTVSVTPTPDLIFSSSFEGE